MLSSFITGDARRKRLNTFADSAEQLQSEDIKKIPSTPPSLTDVPSSKKPSTQSSSETFTSDCQIQENNTAST